MRLEGQDDAFNQLGIEGMEICTKCKKICSLKHHKCRITSMKKKVKMKPLVKRALFLGDDLVLVADNEEIINNMVVKYANHEKKVRLSYIEIREVHSPKKKR